MKGSARLLILLLAIGLNSCTLSRMVIYQFSDIKDYKRFASRPLTASPEPFVFPSLPNEQLLATTPLRVQHAEQVHDLDSLLPHTNSVAFLIIQGDSIRYENYFHDYTDTSWVASFSMAKSFTSALMGAAIDEGKIGGVDELVVDYIPELKKYGWEKVTLKHVLLMNTGVHHQENYFNPFAGVARSYYGRKLSREVTRLKKDYEAGKHWGYKSINTQLLGEIVVRATGRTLTDYMQEKIWTPLGMEHPASWSLDQRKNGMEKAFCCINATARDFARFGRLYLHGGNWNGQQVISEEWVRESTRAHEGNVSWYGYQWWLPTKDEAFAAEGHLGQFIYVHPKHDLIIVRLGKNSGKVNWYRIFGQIAAQMSLDA